jgi:hypothetical protein
VSLEIQSMAWIQNAKLNLKCQRGALIRNAHPEG